MFEVFLNEVPQGHGVLQVQLEQLGNATASGHVGAHNGNSLALRGEVDLSTLLHLFNGDAPRVMVSPDDQPPRPPRIAMEIFTTNGVESFQAPIVMVSPHDDPPRPPRVAMEPNSIADEQSFLAPRVMISPDDEPPRPPR